MSRNDHRKPQAEAIETGNGHDAGAILTPDCGTGRRSAKLLQYAAKPLVKVLGSREETDNQERLVLEVKEKSGMHDDVRVVEQAKYERLFRFGGGHSQDCGAGDPAPGVTNKSSTPSSFGFRSLTGRHNSRPSSRSRLSNVRA